MDYGPICGLVLRRTTSPPPKLKLEQQKVTDNVNRTRKILAVNTEYLAGTECREVRSQVFPDDQVDSDETEDGRLADTTLAVIVALHTQVEVNW